MAAQQRSNNTLCHEARWCEINLAALTVAAVYVVAGMCSASEVNKSSVSQEKHAVQGAEAKLSDKNLGGGSFVARHCLHVV